MNYICTYFYYNEEPDGSVYPSANCKLDSRNEVYWRTVYCCLLSNSICTPEAQLVLFTNKSSFPYRLEIEGLNVLIFDNIDITRVNTGQWAAVLFFFDVLKFISNYKGFQKIDNFILLDTDVLAQKNCIELFNKLHTSKLVFMAYLSGICNSKTLFHNTEIGDLESIGCDLYGMKEFGRITELIGGEFFAFNKGNVMKLLEETNQILSIDSITTEEQVLSILHKRFKFSTPQNTIVRFWTSHKYYSKLKSNDIFFLHLPAEKKFGLFFIFEHLINKKNIRLSEYQELVIKFIPYKNKYRMLFKRIVYKIRFMIHEKQ